MAGCVTGFQNAAEPDGEIRQKGIVMKLKDFFVVIRGTTKFALSETEKPMCGMDFWHRYGGTPEWDRDIQSAKLISRRKDSNGLWYDDVVCIISLA